MTDLARINEGTSTLASAEDQSALFRLAVGLASGATRRGLCRSCVGKLLVASVRDAPESLIVYRPRQAIPPDMGWAYAFALASDGCAPPGSVVAWLGHSARNGRSLRECERAVGHVGVVEAVSEGDPDDRVVRVLDWEGARRSMLDAAVAR